MQQTEVAAEVKLHKKYVPLFSSESRYFVVTGGR